MDPCTPLLCWLPAAGGAPQPIALVAVDAEFAANAEPVSFVRVPSLVCTGVEIREHNGRRLWRLPLAVSAVIPAGATVLLEAGVLRVPLTEVYALGLELEAPAATGGAAGATATVTAPPAGVGAALGGGASAGSQADTHG